MIYQIYSTISSCAVFFLKQVFQFLSSTSPNAVFSAEMKAVDVSYIFIQFLFSQL
jgi:hypothetical protein